MRTFLLALSTALPFVCVAAPASAQDASGASRAATVATSPAPAAPQAAPFAAAAIDDEALQSIAGREDTKQIAVSDQAATVARNSVGDNATTGEARVDGNAFQNMSGLSILNINTGNNVAINAAMTVNISIQPGL